MLRALSLVGAALLLSTVACTAVSEEAGADESNLTGTRAIGEIVVLNGDGVRLRMGPSTKRTAIGLLYKGTKLKLLAPEEGATAAAPQNDFYKVEVTEVPDGEAKENVGKQGWVAGRFLDGTADPAPDENDPVDEAAAEAAEKSGTDDGSSTPAAAACSGSNSTRDSATDLGEFTDSGARMVNDMAGEVGSDERWYKLLVKDVTNLGDPDIKVDVTGSDLEVTVFFSCQVEGASSSSTCSGGTPVEADGMKGCTDPQHVQLATSCDSTSDESGNAFIRIRKKSSTGADANACTSYKLNVDAF